MHEQPSLSAVSRGISPENRGAYTYETEVELPVLADGESTLEWNHTPRARGSWARFVGSAVLGAAILAGGLYLWPSGGDESQHPNWPHVAAATRASEKGLNRLVRVSPTGDSEMLPALEVTGADADRLVTGQVRLALLRDDVARASSLLQGAQRIPATTSHDVELPDLAADMDLATALKDGRKELFRIELFDCCQEDGDIVEVLVNGSHFSTVPITNAGTMLSIPLSAGSNTITILGAQDGRGGVTLSLRTSRGEFFARRMRVGEAFDLGVIVR